MLETSLNTMLNHISAILQPHGFSAYLYGSVTNHDFKPGWSDIDFLCLTQSPIHHRAAEALLPLRQALTQQYPGNAYFKLFEGAITTLDVLIHHKQGTTVYWGSSGQRITNSYHLCPFSTISLLESGRCVHGQDIRHLIKSPSPADIIAAIKAHYHTIRTHGKSGGGWMLDIARCLYTLKTNKVIAKTKAGEWAIAQTLCPDIQVMETVVDIRKNPMLLTNSIELQNFSNSLENHIQAFADVLERALH